MHSCMKFMQSNANKFDIMSKRLNFHVNPRDLEFRYAEDFKIEYF